MKNYTENDMLLSKQHRLFKTLANRDGVQFIISAYVTTSDVSVTRFEVSGYSRDEESLNIGEGETHLNINNWASTHQAGIEETLKLVNGYISKYGLITECYKRG